MWIQRKACKRDLLENLKYKMINFGEYTNEKKIDHNSKWPYIPDHPYRTLIIGGSFWIRKNKCIIEFNK